MSYTMMSPKENILAALDRTQTVAIVLGLLCIGLGWLAVVEWRDQARIQRELDRVAPDIRNYDDGFHAGQLEGFNLARRLSIWDLRTGSSGSQIIRVLGVPDSVEVVSRLPTGDPDEWRWTYGTVVLTVRRGDIEGDEFLVAHTGPLRELVEAKKAEREPKLNDF